MRNLLGLLLMSGKRPRARGTGSPAHGARPQYCCCYKIGGQWLSRGGTVFFQGVLVHAQISSSRPETEAPVGL